LPHFNTWKTVQNRHFTFDDICTVLHACCMTQAAADLSFLAEQQPDVLAGEIKGSFIQVERELLKRPVHRPKENEAFATEVAYAYSRLRVEGLCIEASLPWLPEKGQSGLSAKQAEWRICEQYKISRAYLFKLVRQVVYRHEY
jgi:hypothetical protein